LILRGTTGAVNDVIEVNSLMLDTDCEIYADAGYQGAGKRPNVLAGVNWNIEMWFGKRRLLDPAKPIEALTEKLERVKAGIRVWVECPFRVLKRQFEHVKMLYRGLAKNTAQLHTLFALANLWMVRRQLLGAS
jgi:IS5 family transposase